MLRLSLFATALVAGLSGAALAQQQGASISQDPQGMVPGQRMQLGPMMGNRVVRQVQFNNNGGVDIVYSEPDIPQTQRVLRLENINGMLEVVYDTKPGGGMDTQQGGTPRLVAKGGGMYDVEYDKR